jgi:hypothetical protein
MKVELLDVMGSDLTVVNAARVSFAMESEEFGSRDKKLVRYLAATDTGHHSHTYRFSCVSKRLCSSLGSL